MTPGGLKSLGALIGPISEQAQKYFAQRTQIRDCAATRKLRNLRVASLRPAGED